MLYEVLGGVIMGKGDMVSALRAPEFATEKRRISVEIMLISFPQNIWD